MAVEWVHIKSRSGGRDEKGYRNYKITYQVKTDDRDDGPLSATDDPALPAMYSSYSSGNDVDPYAIVVGYEVEPWSDADDNPYLWKVVVTYSSNPQAVSGDFGNLGSNDGTVGTPTSPNQTSSEQAPEARPWQVEFGTRQREKVLGPVDNTLPDPKWVLNSAGQIFENPPQVPWSDSYVTITAWRSTADYNKVAQYKNTVNDYDFLGFEPGQLRCSDYKITSQYERGAYTYQVVVTLDIADFGENWNELDVLDAGTRVKDGATGFKNVVDGTGHPITIPLDGAGNKLDSNNPDDFIYIRFAPYPEADFTNLI